MVAANDQGGRREAKPRAHAPQASTAWSIPEIRVVKDDQGRLRIDQSDPATYGAYAARQLLATAEADPKYRDGMTKRPSVPSIKITYVNGVGEPQEIGVREIFCRMDGDALVLTKFETADGEKVKDLPITVPLLGELDADVDDADRLHEIAMAELGDVPLPPAEIEPEHEAARPAPSRERRLPTGPLRQYDEAADPAPAAGRSRPHRPLSRRRAVQQLCRLLQRRPEPTTGPPAKSTLRSLDDGEATSLRTLIEAKAGQTRWANGLLMQAAERHPSDRRLQNEHLANLLRVSLDPSRAESRTPLAAALRGILEEVHAYKAGVLDRDPLKAEKLALQPFARTALDTDASGRRPGEDCFRHCSENSGSGSGEARRSEARPGHPREVSPRNRPRADRDLATRQGERPQRGGQRKQPRDRAQAVRCGERAASAAEVHRRRPILQESRREVQGTRK